MKILHKIVGSQLKSVTKKMLAQGITMDATQGYCLFMEDMIRNLEPDR
jgi:hypothetical protein